MVYRQFTSQVAASKPTKCCTGFTDSILRAVNAMMLDMLAAVARKDYEDRLRRQFQGIHKAKTEGKYQGRQPDLKRRQHIASLLHSGHSYSEIQEMLSCSRHLIASVAKEQTQADAVA